MQIIYYIIGWIADGDLPFGTYQICSEDDWIITYNPSECAWLIPGTFPLD